MNREEAEKLADTPETVEGLLKLFTKSAEEYTREDFIDGTEPYDYLLLYKDDPFTLERKRQKIEAAAKKAGVRNFSKIFKDYCAAHDVDTSSLNVTDFPDQPIALRCGNYVCNQNGVRINSETVCPHPIMPVARMVNIDTGIEKIKIAFWRGKGWRTAIFDRKTISTANKITDLSDIGVAVTSESAKKFVKYFAKLEALNDDLIPEIECFSHLGWNRQYFVPFKGKNEIDGGEKFGEILRALTQTGSYDKWFDEIVKIRSYSAAAKIVIAASFASCLIKPLCVQPFFVHLWGAESGTGKTVAQMAGASVWGNPKVGESFFQTFSATKVGPELMAGFLHSIPVFFDELQLLRDRYGKIMFNVYELAAGAGKLRGTKTLGVAKTPTWNTCFITSGESAIVGNSDGEGALNRVVEIECRANQKCVENGQRSAEILTENYGFGGRGFVLKLLEENNILLAKKIFSVKYDACIHNDTTGKQAMAAAAILTADALASEWIFGDEALTAEEIGEFMKTKDEVSLSERGYRYICDWVAANYNRFGAVENGEIYGTITDNIAYINRSIFNRACEGAGFNPKSLLSHFKSKEKIALRKSGIGTTVPKRLAADMPPVECIALKLPDKIF